MNVRWPEVKPGWYLLVALFVYAVAVTFALQGRNAELRELRVVAATAEAAPAPEPRPQPLPVEPSGLWFPLPGASLPASDARLPGAERPYRSGVSQGFDFYDGEVGVPVPFGAPVIAAAAGRLERVDAIYTEMTPDAFATLLADVASAGATEEQLDLLRGRQVWLRTADGRLLRYAHLASVRPGLRAGQEVHRGQVLGYVGNSGTDAGVAGIATQARLHFEIWDGESFFGQDLDTEAVRIAAASLFTGP